MPHWYRCLLREPGNVGMYVFRCALLRCLATPATSRTVNREWERETAKYAIAIKADPISNPEVRGNLADTPQYDYWEKKKAQL